MSRFTGYVLRGTNTAPTNAKSTAETSTGVVRDVHTIPQMFNRLPPFDNPWFVDARADQYRTAVLESPGTTTQEYLVWAENTSSLTIIEDPTDPAWQTGQCTKTFQVGTLPVLDVDPTLVYNDGTDHFVVVDEGGRSLSAVLWIVLARGDTVYDDDGWVDDNDPSLGRNGSAPYLVFSVASADQNPVSGLVTLSSAQLASLGGGLSTERGDQIISVRYTLASSRFWWTRNDRYETRFGWNGKTQKWQPYKGSSPKNLGRLLLDQTYLMDPKVTNLPIGSFLSGDSLVPDSYAMIRLGTDPGVTSQPVGSGGAFVGIQVKPDRDVESFDFSTSPTLSGIMGQTRGELRFNPDFVQLNAGKTLWYIPKVFSPLDTGIVGKLLDAATTPVFIAPVPGPLDCPLIRLGNRHYLTASVFLNDVALDSAPAPLEGEVLVSLSTGRLRLSQADIGKADPNQPTLFSKHFLGEDIIYDGVALNAIPQPAQKSVQLVDAAGNPATGNSSSFYVPDSIVLPDEFTDPSNLHRGLGVSGIIDAPDGTGALPAQPFTPATVRPGGDQVTDQNTGRIRQVVTDVGDTVFFSCTSATTTIHVVDRESDLPRNARSGEAWVAKERSVQGSRVVFNREDLSAIGDSGVYFLQATFLPAMHTQKAQLISRNRDIFRFDGTEVLYYAIGGLLYQWPSSILLAALPNNQFFTPQEVASSIETISGPGSAYALSGRVVLADSDLDTGSVEIGFGTGVKDLSGAAALGFLPGWRVQGGVSNWLVDAGLGVGLFRSPVDLDRTQGYPDFADVARVTNGVIQESIQPSPFVFLDNPPLQDVAGIDENVFFSLTSMVDDGSGNVTPVIKPLENYQDIIYRFGQGKFDWIAEDTSDAEILQPVSTIPFPHMNVVPESLLAAPGIGGGLFVSEYGGASVFQVQDSDYILPQEGASGTAILTQRYGQRTLFGAMGRVVTAGGSLFEDTSVDFSAVGAGYRLKVTSGGSSGSYLVTSVLSPTTIEVSPVLRVVDSLPVTWELFEGFPESVYDPALVADMFYVPFQHLISEPFQVRMLSPVGSVPVAPGTHLTANMAGALASGRAISIRYGLTVATSSNTATLIGLTSTLLGTIANGSLVVPVAEPRFGSGAFEIQIGGTSFVPVGVTIFSDPVPAGTIEYLTIDVPGFSKGSLKFALDLLTDYALARVRYVETFLPAADLLALTVEYDGMTGLLNFSQADMALWGGAEAYFVEQMITEDRKDVSLSPLVGAFAFVSPVPRGSTIEAEYYAADLEGRKIGDLITEFLPVFVRNEVAVRVDSYTYTFNANGLTADQTIAPIIYTGAIMKNFGTTDCLVSYPPQLNGLGQISFLKDAVTSDTVVKITYAVFEAQGGERAYETSTKPVYRPPFFIKANQSRFGLRGDRSADFVAGQMLRFGDECFYVTGTTFYPTSANGPVTSVDIFPTTVNEVGSRSPANDVLSVVTARPITTVTGFLSSLDLNTFPFEPVSRGQSTVTFQGNLMQFAVAGHIFEIGGYPHTISQAELSEDGTRTRITVTSPFLAGFSMDTPPMVRLSYRPIYPPQTFDFVGVGSVVGTEPYELIRFGTMDPLGELPGQTLVEGIDYTLDTNTGAIKILEPNQVALGGSQKLSLSFTRLRTLQPTIQNGIVVPPRVTEAYLHTDIPTSQNGLLGGLLTGTYTFRNPDTFYFRAVPMGTFLGEMAQEAITEITARQPAGGPITPTESTKNWDQGRLGLLSQRKHLVDKDRAARVFLDFYNRTINAFEQIEETISGGFIGDRDGKFRFWIGTGQDYPTPGYEDSITGVLSPRFVWNDAFNGQLADPGTPNVVPILPTDWVVTPNSFTLTTGVVDGQIPNPDRMYQLLTEQEQLVLNDVDDLIITRLGKPKGFRSTTFPFRHFKVQGKVARMVDQHSFSRIFPTVTRAFFTTFPGVGSDSDSDPGVYTAGRYTSSGTFEKTRGHEIGQLYNPVLGDLDNVRTAKLSKRRARAHVWGYFPNGIPAGVFDGGLSVAITTPCIVASPALFRDILVDPSTGYPDSLQFFSQDINGVLPDLEAGDPDLSIPGFMAGDEIEWGKPDGTTYRALCPVGVDIYGTPSFTGLFVDSVLYGCVLTLKDGNDNVISSPYGVLVGTGAASGTPAHLYPIEQGDTVFVGPNIGTTSEPADPPTRNTMATMASNIDAYRNGFDLEINSDGSIEDKTYPSQNDPSYLPIKELLGQNPPDPLSPLEGPVSFFYASENPLEIPALKGDITDDSGDYQIPYIRSANTELDRFGEIFTGLTNLMNMDNLGANAVYPDEILSNDCDVDGASNSLHFPVDISPASAPGVGPVMPYDLMLVQAEATGPFTAGTPALSTVSPQGIFSVAKQGSLPADGYVEVPRFVTQTTPPGAGSSLTGSPVRYTLNNAMGYIDPGSPYGGTPQVFSPPGMEILETISDSSTYLCFDSIGAIALNDGVNPGTGNLNDFLAASANNRVIIHVYSRWDSAVTAGLPPGPHPPLWPVTAPGGVEVLKITLQHDWVTVDTYQGAGIPQACVTPPVFGTSAGAPHADPGNRHIKIPLWGIIPWDIGTVPPLLPENEWVIPFALSDLGGPNETRISLYGYEFAVDVTTGVTGQSDTAWISEDRLTFNEVMDMRLALPRGTTHPQSSIDMAANLTIWGINVGNTAGTNFWSTVDSWGNGTLGANPDPFTFPAPIGGTWTPLAGLVTERGSLKVCGYEGWNNTPIFGTGITASLLPSNDRDETGKILMGVGKTASKYSAALLDAERWDDRIADLTVVLGSVSKVVPGDIVIVESSANATHFATTMAGTYLVRHAVEPTPGVPFREVSLSATAGSEAGWCPVHFPTVVSYTSPTLVLSDLAPAAGGTPVGPSYSGFAPTGRLYILVNVVGLSSLDETTFRNSLVSVEYTALATNPSLQAVFTLDTATFLDAAGDAILEADFLSRMQLGMSVSGMFFLPIQVGGESGLPDNNCVGYDTDADLVPPASGRAAYGFRWITLSPPSQLLEDAAVQAVAFGADPGDPGFGKIDKVPAPFTIVPMMGAVTVANTILPTNTCVYNWVADTLDISQMTTIWSAINVPPSSWGSGPGTNLVECLLPFSVMDLANTRPVPPVDANGFYAQGGVFLEPSFPRMATNLVNGYPGHRHVVDATNSLLDPSVAVNDRDREIGIRDSDDYAVVPHVPGTGVPEEVIFSVKRIRRFHNAWLAQNLKPLWYAYEIRRGIVTAYTADPVRQTGVVEANNFYMNWTVPPAAPKPADVWEDGSGPHLGTNLGPFTDRDVNIHPGDMFRLLGDDGTLVEEIPIAAVLNGYQILLALPGITKVINPNGYRFEIYLKRAPVPHEQSNEQLLELVMDHEVYRTDADWSTEEGGYVPDMGALGTTPYSDVANHLCDDLRAPTPATPFSALGVRKGDIVIVDPSGTIPRVGPLPAIREKGARPLGDEGTPGRLDAGGNPVYTAGKPTPLDDNRGFYRVTKVDDSTNPPHIEVNPVNTFAGDAANQVVFAPLNDRRAYAVYPTINDSVLTPQEGQMDLRPTAVRDPVTKKFSDRSAPFLRFHSIRPFSYRVIRPSALFSDEDIDLVLMHRERILSLIEMIRRVLAGYKMGTYYVFQRDEHLEELGNPDDPDIGLGVLSNDYLLALVGRTNVVPFSNNEYALSLLDRRFWVHDTRLDSLTTDPTNPFNMIMGTPAYTAYNSDPDGIDVNPVMPERIEQILDTGAKFRDLRYVWLAYRTHKSLGTLSAITRFDAELPKRIQEQKRTQLQLESMSKAGVS